MVGWIGVAACFDPSPRNGLPCTGDGECPPGQSCGEGICSSEAQADAAHDAEVAAADAAAVPALFGDPVLVPIACEPVCGELRDPWLDPTQTSLYFTAFVGGGVDVYVATRATAQVDFGLAGPAGTINTVDTEHAPFLSADGLRMWFSREVLPAGPPHDEVLVSEAPFTTAVPVSGVINTTGGDERGVWVSADGNVMLFARSSELAPADHDIYLARQDGGQWDTVERVPMLDRHEEDERSVWVLEEQRSIFVVRDGMIIETSWRGDDMLDLGTELRHTELDMTPLDDKYGVWASPEGNEIWFSSNRGGVFSLYRAVR